jgi:hypothetical protein
MKKLFGILALALALAIPASAQITGLPAHKHTSAATGGANIGAHTASGTATATIESVILRNGNAARILIGGGSSNSTSTGALLVLNGASYVGGGTGTGEFSMLPVSGAAAMAYGPLSITVAGGGTGSFSSDKPCGSGYIRLNPNYCYRGGTNAAGTALVTTVCTQITPPTSDARALYLELRSASAGAVAVNVQGFDQSSCVATGRLFNADFPPSVLGVSFVTTNVILPIANISSSNSSRILFIGADATTYTIRGYYD